MKKPAIQDSTLAKRKIILKHKGAIMEEVKKYAFIRRVEGLRRHLRELALGGIAVCTGVNSSRE
jgi:hypothetical protein